MSIFLCFLFLFPLFLIIFKKISPSKMKLPPGPTGLPIIGNLHQFGRLLHSSLHKLSLEHGPVMLLRFGVVPVVVISSKEAAKEVLKTHDLETCTRPKMVTTGLFSYNFKDIGFTQYGEDWREMKKLVGLELFSPKKQKSFRYIREEESDLLVKKISKSAQTQTQVDLGKALFSFTAGILFRLAFGKNFRECDFIDMERVEELVTETETNVGTLAFTDFFPTGLGWLIDRLSGQRSRMNKVFSKLTNLFQHVIDDHLKTEQHRDHSDLISAMLDMINKPTNIGSFKITSDHLKGVMSDVFLAGVNAGVITMIWTMTELIRHPGVMKKLQEEIRATLGSNKERITEEDLQKVEYLKMVIEETFRLHPPAPILLPRLTMSDIKIQGYNIPKNTMIEINIYTIGRDPKCWTNPDEFIPERFFNTSINYKGQHFELLPFGAGRRSCPGMALGITILELGLLNLLYFFNWSLPDGMTIADIDMEEAGALNIAKKIPLELVPTLPSSFVNKKY
ncbi:Cytochrome P450 superfamily [Arabidopsis suecica]|uniref:Cytochrome P450 superfamily n=1 Tax=Arabidopsis suecica TaxID=45249 RepID=A0A8T1ZZ83_ARASU|nr:Cytochrome P450 superfamily [Arabidopsis suecica]